MGRKEHFSYIEDLTLVDQDDTILRTTAEIYVRNQDGHRKVLSNDQFNAYRLAPGESYDLSEFRDARKFLRESTPLEPFYSKAKLLYNNLRSQAGYAFVILTARSDLDDVDQVLTAYSRMGFDKAHMRIERAGNLGIRAPSLNKAEIVRAYLEDYRPKNVRMYDDSNSNLACFLALKSEFPEVNFYAYKIDKQGNDHAFHPADLNGSNNDWLHERLTVLFDRINRDVLFDPAAIDQLDKPIAQAPVAEDNLKDQALHSVRLTG